MRDTIEMAREAGLVCSFRPCSPWVEDYDLTPHLKAFEVLVRADERDRALRENAYVQTEREACAKVCDAFQSRDVGMQPAECAGAIRARGNT